MMELVLAKGGSADMVDHRYLTPYVAPHLAHISPISCKSLAHTSPMYRLCIAHLSPTSRKPHLQVDQIWQRIDTNNDGEVI